MSVWYELSGSIRLRNEPEIGLLIDRITALAGGGFEISYAGDEEPPDSGVITLTISGSGAFAAGGVLDLDAAIEALGPHAVEPAVFEYEYDGDHRDVLVVGPSAESVAAAESRHVLEEVIMPALGRLTAEDAWRLIERLRVSCVQPPASVMPAGRPTEAGAAALLRGLSTAVERRGGS